MIKDESSGYGWGNGMMYVKGNEGAPESLDLVGFQLIRCYGNPATASTPRRWLDEAANRKTTHWK